MLRPVPCFVSMLIAACCCSCLEAECDDDRRIDVLPVQLRAACYQDRAGAIRDEYQSESASGVVIHMGGDSAQDNVPGMVAYGLRLGTEVKGDLTLQLLYSDDVASNRIDVLWDGVRAGQLQSGETGSWNRFERSAKISLGQAPPGRHTLRLQLASGGSYGVILDAIVLQDETDEALTADAGAPPLSCEPPQQCSN
ncbi:MAG TPA: hypothetical protein VHO25_13995 [Polyangiaceae bacterium]|nr:hypothetical protein [Polyangiaceae bacterium]